MIFRKNSEKRFGIVDIGSNSVRLVVYAAAARSPVLVFNEKILCGLGRHVVTTGRLDPKGIERALNALRRFIALRSLVKVEHLEVVATAAVRDATDGPEFLARVNEICGFPARLLSGDEEARLSGLGVLAGIPDAQGIIGDLGGGSLELIAVGHGAMAQTATLPLGPLQLMDQPAGAAARVDEQLVSVDWLSKQSGGSLYMVGGVWRNLARLHMAQRDYPIRTLHQYAIPRADAINLTGLIEKLGPQSLAGIPDISERRIEALPYGALVLERLLQVFPARDVIVSAYGLREGVLFDRLSKAERAKDPLIEGSRDLARRLARFPEHGDELVDWTTGLFSENVLEETPAEERLRHAACILADIGWSVHPDYRAHHCMNQILLAPFAGVDHPGRLFLARTGFHRHEGSGKPMITGNIEGLLSEEQNHRALILGLAFRLAFTLCAATPRVLPRTSLDLSPKKVTLTVPPEYSSLLGEVVLRRLSRLAKALDRKAETRLL